MTLLRLPERAGGDDLRDHRPLPLPRRVDTRLDLLGGAPLLVGGVEDGRSVLRALDVPLLIHRRRVVHAEEPAEEILVRQDVGMEDDLDRPALTCLTRM